MDPSVPTRNAIANTAPPWQAEHTPSLTTEDGRGGQASRRLKPSNPSSYVGAAALLGEDYRR